MPPFSLRERQLAVGALLVVAITLARWLVGLLNR